MEELIQWINSEIRVKDNYIKDWTEKIAGHNKSIDEWKRQIKDAQYKVKYLKEAKIKLGEKDEKD